ncbi:hypothetical protein GW920_01990 [Candidatus Falkowbacteria bacterium]|uniref:3D domain-containing protein n=1 Tax=Candidatus Falkowbacteria bacterium CG10_big_fil_rev_8_21_14_0_10_37_18 TaxID=1974562 RepID=A0A2H0VAC0_9BACT|nr:hypothetical protein [Candidatus Falkowbacteria bacterium]NCQ12781.1 hypothetical protein [Candidatus Falkowbacteria bacterium]PIR95270.1 MAG: hypothetical protein COT93_03390 [Candidatus Falkowbacteria bacterium CG10_big_fil_rev_8_21_14_0_10_37_18]
MKIIQIIKDEVLPLDNRKNLVLLIIIACIFQFVLFYAPALADQAVNAAQAETISPTAMLADGSDFIIGEQMVKRQEMDNEAAKFQPVALALISISTSSPMVSTTSPTIASSTQNMTEASPDANTPTSTLKVVRSSSHVITAYNSEVGQTDDSPCITANGFNVCKHGEEDTIAANFLKFGTKVQIPELFGDRIFIVRDRMNRKYPNRIDVWMLERQDALKFGFKVATIKVVE